MTEKISPWLRRDALSTFGNVCIEATHTESTNQTTNQNLHPVGMRRVQAADYACANFHPFPGVVDSSPRHPPSLPDLFRLRASLSTSSPALLPVSSSPFTDDDGVCVYRRHLPRPRVFRNSFCPESIPPSRRVETVGAATMGVQRVQPSVSGLSLVSLVTAPHKGIAL